MTSAFTRLPRSFSPALGVAILMALLFAVAAAAGRGHGSLDPSFGKNVLGGTDHPMLLFERGDGCSEYLYTVRADGSQLQRVTHDGQSLSGSWSPDGRDIYFLRGNGDCTSAFFADVFRMRADGSQVRQLTHLRSGSLWFSVAPDGRRLAINDASSLIVSDTNGQHMNVIAKTAGGIYPIWSPDGGRILYNSPAGLRVITRDGTHKSRLIGNLGPSDSYEAGAWSPSGKVIVYSGCSGTRCGHAALWLVRPDGTRKTQLKGESLRQGAEDVSPSWSPDGKQIAFIRATSNVDSLKVLTLANHRLQTLAQTGCCDSPAWSPEGSWIAFESDTGIAITRRDGSEPRRVTTNDKHGDSDGSPRWRP
jgi:Tol biopolymer transport system component